MSNICFTGGGSSGHVTPNLAIIKKLTKEKSMEVFYIGSYNGIENDLVKKNNISYYAISSGKLRRYFSWKNFIDPLEIIKGIFQSYFLLKKLKPKVIFSKGGFVTFPVVVAGKLNRIPIICHESDFIPGLANKLIFPLADKICLTFAASKKNIKYKNKTEVTGAVIRQEFFDAKGSDFLEKEGLDETKKTILITGGGLGSTIINTMVYKCLHELLKHFNIIHITGKNKLNYDLKNLEQNNLKNYVQVEYLNEDMFSAMALADLVISRAGSNTLYELLLLKKKHILIPLSKEVSRGDQIDNALYFSKQGLSYVILEENLTQENLQTTISKVFSEENSYQIRLADYQCLNGTDKIISILKKYT